MAVPKANTVASNPFAKDMAHIPFQKSAAHDHSMIGERDDGMSRCQENKMRAAKVDVSARDAIHR
jgi:hypothetical protein